MILKHNLYTLGCCILLLTGGASCNKFLEEKPSKTTSLVVTSAQQLDELLNSYREGAIFYQEANATAVYSTDDYELTPAIYNARPGTFSLMAIQFSHWDTQFIPGINSALEGFWSGEYKKIFYANMALEYLPTVTGTEELKARIKADAHFIRAYSYFNLANNYCLPYTEANKNEPGLPIKLSVSFEESLARQPLHKVYEQIEADLAEALKTPDPLVQNGKARHWRASKAGVNAFAARYYLNRNNYQEALKYANSSLAEYSTLVNYNTDMRYGRDVVYNIDGGTPNAKSVTVKYPYTHDNQVDFTDRIAWKEFLYFRTLVSLDWWYIPSQSLLNLYDQSHDLRYRYHVVENYSYDRGFIKPSFEAPGYIFFFKDGIPSGPTVAEMLLIKAECLARTNQLSDAMTAVNTLRAARMEPGAWVNLSASSQPAAVKLITEERRREMPFTQRWADLRRYNNNNDATDDVVVTRQFYPFNATAVLTAEGLKTYTLPSQSRRYAAPLLESEIISAQGQVIQNTY